MNVSFTRQNNGEYIQHRLHRLIRFFFFYISYNKDCWSSNSAIVVSRFNVKRLGFYQKPVVRIFKYVGSKLLGGSKLNDSNLNSRDSIIGSF